MRRTGRTLLLLGIMSFSPALPGPASLSFAQTAASPPLGSEAHSAERLIVSTGTTVTGEPIRYPTGAAAHITAVEITLAPGQQTGWHMHAVPMFGYILEGELSVDYGPRGERIYHAGDGFMEAMNERHNGRNSGQAPVRILAVAMGEQGMQASEPATPPPR
jgi:quercetin dioxygenase-like cupin family protein